MPILGATSFHRMVESELHQVVDDVAHRELDTGGWASTFVDGLDMARIKTLYSDLLDQSRGPAGNVRLPGCTFARHDCGGLVQPAQLRIDLAERSQLLPLHE